MGIYRRLKAGIGAAALLCCTTGAFAGVFSQNPDPAQVQQGGSVVLTFRFAGDGATQDSQLDLAYNAANFTVSAPTALVAGSVCAVLTAPDRIRIVPPSGAGTPLPSAVTPYCSFNFTAGGAVPFGDYDFTVNFIECVSAAGAETCTFTPPGRISVVNITSPGVTYNPVQDADGVTDPGTVEVQFGGGGIGQAVAATVTFDATGGTTGQNVVVGPCSITGSAGITLTPFTPVTVNDGDPPGDTDGTIALSCTLAAATQAAVLTCTEDGSVGAPVTRLWDVACPQGGATPPTIAYNPTVGTAINFQGPAATVVNQTITVTETAQGQAGSTVTVDGCAIAPANAVWGPITGQPITINGGPPSQNGTLGLSCTIPPATVSGTLTCNETTNTGVGNPSVAPRSWPVNCLGPSPEFNSNPAENTVVTLQGLPGSTANRTIAVTNSGTADLTVTGCAITGPDAVNFTAPVVTGSPIPPQGAGSIAFSCTTPAAQGATFSATLTCTTNDLTDGEDTVTWPLACTSVVLSIPTMGLWGKIALGMGVLALGLFGFAMRRRFQ